MYYECALTRASSSDSGAILCDSCTRGSSGPRQNQYHRGEGTTDTQGEDPDQIDLLVSAL